MVVIGVPSSQARGAMQEVVQSAREPRALAFCVQRNSPALS
jgi:hypothetical protein